MTLERGDLFETCCGAGGMAEGFSPFFNIVHAIDIKECAVRTYKANHNETKVRRSDIRNITGCRGDYEGMMGIIGGPPCQGSSFMNPHRCQDDPRNGLLMEFMRIVSEVLPDFFVLENVLSVSKKRKLEVIDCARSHDYFVTSLFLNAADYGASQIRKRWIVVGMKEKKWSPPEKTGSGTVRKAFAQLKQNWGIMKSSDKTLKILERASPEWSPMTGSFDNMIRLSWDIPSPTIVNLKKIYMVHPSEVRNISLAEAAALQGFPPGFKWEGTQSEIAQMIANAMPSQFAYSIAQSIREGVS